MQLLVALVRKLEYLTRMEILLLDLIGNLEVVEVLLKIVKQFR